ncbi:MAG TPA: tyrosine/phenylalanine carboxypeptidase domain-containing protein, partial [Polyangiaceae bacterium]|nr:tyrosine/phenylalanine carboxypeptidase domain-containing protein [Polyangiaceae bacterium]
MDGGGAHRWRKGESNQRAPAGPLTFAAADELFGRAERRIALLARVRPDNLRAASAVWAAALRRGARAAPTWRYAPAPDLADLRRALAIAARVLPAVGALGRLYALRAEELELEARLAENVGSPAFAELARLRHPERRGQEHDRAGELATAWATLVASEPGPRHRSDDRRHPESLVSLLSREIARLRLPLRLELRPDMQSRAACGDGVVFVCTGVSLRASEARRIAAHELLGHALPRLAARSHPLGLLRVGCARSSDDEEGRALHIEERSGLLDEGRRRELAWRHLAALWVAGGADAHDCVDRLRQFGCELE